MPKTSESINQDLEDLLVSRGYEVTSLDSSGKEVPVSSAADLLQFHFHRDGKDYGTVTITIDGLQKLTIYYDDEIADSGGISESNDDQGGGDTSWLGLLKQMKKFAQQHQLGFVLKDTDRLRNDMKRRVHAKKLEESKAKEMNKKQKVAESSHLPKDEASIRRELADAVEEANWQIERNGRNRAEYHINRIKELQALLPKSKTGLDIDRSVPGVTRARISDVDPETMGNKLDKLKSFRNFQAGVADQGGSGRVRPKISSDNYTQRDDVQEDRSEQMSPGGADYSKHSTDELKAMLRPGVMHRNELKFKTLIRRELKKRAQQGVAEGEEDPQSELKLINQKLKDAYKQVRNNSSVSIGWYMSQVKELKARREELIKQLRQGVAEGSAFDDWADDRAASQLWKLNPATEWTVSYDYGPHMTKSVTVKARSEQEARDKVEKAAEKKGISIMINSVEPAQKGVDEGSIEEALQSPPTSTGNELLDEFIGKYVKDGWKYHGTNKRGGHEFRKRRYMPAALYGLKDGGVIESHNNGTRVSRFDSSGKRVAKLADGPLSERGEAKDNQTKLDEGYYGNKKMSYNDDTPTVKMVIKHNRQLEETDQRFRHIEKIFLETSDGERFSVPTNKPSRARMFARHIAEGGEYRDDRWSHLNEICEDLDKLSGFVRATHNKREQFNESAQRMIGEAQEQYIQLRETVKKLSGTKGYNKYFESYEPRMISEDEGDLSEAFMHSSIDTRIENALPTLSKFGIKMGKIAESDMFAEWADSLVNETLDPDSPRQVEALVELLGDEIPVGPNAEVAIGELNDVIEDDELYNRLRRAAKANPDSDARPQIIAWMQEQDNENYRKALEQIESDDSDSEKDQAELKKANQSDAEEPAKVKPKKSQPQPGAQPAGGLPPLPGGNAGGLPPLPPLPPLGESDLALASFKRLLGR